MRLLLKRIALLSLASALGIALLAPLSARSAVAVRAERASQLLEAAAHPPRPLGDLGDPGRGTSGLRTLALVPAPAVEEDLAPPAEPPTPATIAMQPDLVAFATPEPVAAQVAAVTPEATTSPRVTGLATWYCCSLGYRGQAVVALAGALGGHYDPTPAWYVTVCADRCASLPVVDYCQCYWATADQKIADLSPEAWAAVSDRPLSAGVVHVTIDLGR
jgi:hypothetical protein